MENASKALIMAGSVLMALLVIGCVSLVYHQISRVEQAKNDAEKTSKLVNYTEAFGQYDRKVYGSELLSLANLQSDYNYRRVETNEYRPITITVEIKTAIKENNVHYLSAGKQDISKVREGLWKLEEKIANYESDSEGYRNKKEKRYRSVKYYAQSGNRNIATLFNIPYTSEETDYDIGSRLATDSTTAKLMADIENYKNLKTTYVQFKNTSFTCEGNVKYRDSGSVSSMHFIEMLPS